MSEFHFVNKFKNRVVRLRDQGELQPSEVFLDELSQKRANQRGEGERKIGLAISQKSFIWLFFCSLFFLSILLLRSFQLQVTQGEQLLRMAERNKFSYRAIKAERGVIYDRNRKQLVFNRSQFLLMFNKQRGDYWEREAADISVFLGLDLNKKLAETGDVVVLDNLTQEQLVSLKIRTRGFANFWVERRMVRDYYQATIFSHLIGYTGQISPEEMSPQHSIHDYVGKSGLERSYEEELRVRTGQIRQKRDALGRIQSEEIISLAKSGNNLVLWSDFELQKKIYEELSKMTSSLGVKNASVVALDPRTGAVLAMVSYPGFDSNLFSGRTDPQELIELFQDPRKPLFNRAISGLYAVGSIIKSLTGLAVLEEEIVSAEKQFYSPGYLKIPNPWQPARPSIFNDFAAPGWYDLRRALAFSSNVYFYITGGGYQEQRGLGPELIKYYLNLFGWGSLTGIDLPGEKGGFIPTPEWKRETLNDSWRIGDTYNLSIGQGYLKTTPLQVAVAYSAIANGGRVLQPMIVQKVIDPDGNILRKNETKVIRENVFDSENIRIIQKGMRDAVEFGSARMLRGLPVKVAAKTGTAQIPKKGHFNNWIALFAPYDKPEIVLTILVEEVPGIRAVVQPLAKNILEWYFRKEETKQ